MRNNEGAVNGAQKDSVLGVPALNSGATATVSFSEFQLN